MCGDDPPRARFTCERQKFRKQCARKNGRYAERVPMRGRGDGLARRFVNLTKLQQVRRRNARLIAKRNEHGREIGVTSQSGGKPGTDARSHSLTPIRIEHAGYGQICDLRPKPIGMRAENHHNRTATGSQQRTGRAADQRLAFEPDQLLREAQARGSARRQKDARKIHAGTGCKRAS